MGLWQELRIATQLRIAAEVARRRAKEFRTQVPNLLGVGAGFRTVRTRHAPLYDEVCMRFTVSHKWPKARPSGQEIPKFIRAKVRVGQGVHWVTIPTDVSSYSHGQQHHSRDLTQGISTALGANSVSYGSVGTLIEDIGDASQKYLLTCRHVVVPTMRKVSPARSCLDSVDDSEIGVFNPPMHAMPDMDAALIQVTDPSVTQLEVWGTSCTGVIGQVDLYEIAARNERLFVLGRSKRPAVPGDPAVNRHDPVAVTLLTPDNAGRQFRYNGTVQSHYWFENVIQYLCDTASPTRPGDSGAALVTADGQLVGMHFYGEQESMGGGATRVVGYAFSASALFASPSPFGVDFRLA